MFMVRLRAALLTPLTGSLSAFGQACATGLTLWAEHAAQLPVPWTGVELDVHDCGSNIEASMRAVLATSPDVLFGPYGSNTMLAAARATSRVLWNHGGATSQLARPHFPHIIPILSPASTYFAAVLQALRAVDPHITTVSLLYTTTGFGRDIAHGASAAAARLNFQLQTIPFQPSHAVTAASTVPSADVLLVVGNFADELAVAPVLLPRRWRAAAFVGAGVEEVLAPLGEQREGLLGPAQWLARVAPSPDEGPDADWFVRYYRQASGSEPPYPAAQAFAAGVLYARCLRDSNRNDDLAQLESARQLACNTLYGAFRLDPNSGLQTGHQMLVVQWQQGTRRVVWPPEQAERALI
ncbi:hypothetical protein KDW_48010 [Dictyobacter vulcani]|uniref:Leucine-binding protein domain-containing protein n=1 Tax=Dictyobacter vulcani TaxID=2607529 RepID=A0A5J4KWY3_9CHLR|nr:ABC transporter substrate-binding protein [Dictyobacter vulcani]GER90639.1 hypothetical protein KDW_48010 [Dictyobacter vulcani]